MKNESITFKVKVCDIGVVNPNNSDESITHEFNLAECPYRELPKDVDYSINEFNFKLPVSKKNIKFKLLTGVEEELISKELEARKKLGSLIDSAITTRLKYIVTDFNGITDKLELGTAVENMLSKDSLALRKELQRVSPDIEMKQEVEFVGGDAVEVAIPLTVNFFWPES